MKLAKPIYESLPYIYFFMSGYLLSLDNSLVLIFSAALFYTAGCVTLVTRSSHRRLDKQIESIKHAIPELIYEYKPYVFGAIAIFTLMLTKNAYIQFAAFTLGVVALRILLFRHNNRCRPKALF
ncbi:hypothetical protein [Thalassotalea piscium]|uniref:Uncharacterized protein n=1 Tax=Thalassotalea piscium TaxID=1230533 RepID=A0A7X0TST3_9GAMM|nr:hypothetical protein [Thalassotalea piscium]MBB6542444.1 hypothetical protein [Thalassotalea piscium]